MVETSGFIIKGPDRHLDKMSVYTKVIKDLGLVFTRQLTKFLNKISLA